ncbi:LacI family transcriptional regulator [Paenibacillus taihuensis]|uniref:LacI family transcriptional regulator n=1 Tax=Paenibacillus taihuensis TaxID=1156355 RepID=A0A3D9QWF3_9BACL|nr:LacI family DNA-binding transcriptional regulator [Paenibacillus taihuensis]REE69564.1 LacI family transcriptional regulator [Paenibacillus taihuensis]
MKKQKVTLETIANEIGTTKVSVFKALKNQPGVSEELRKRVLQVSRELGYVAKAASNTYTSIKLGFLVAKRFFLDTDNFYTNIYYHLSRECAAHNINISLYILTSDEEENCELPITLQQDQNALDGFFIAGQLPSRYMLNAVLKSKLPVVAIDFYDVDLQIDSIVTDNFLSGTMVTQYLIDMGHRDIGFVGDPHYTTNVLDRFCGYNKALIQNQLAFNKDWHLINNDRLGKYTIDYSLPDKLPTAFVCHCDMAAHNLLLKLQSKGIVVPDQVSLISFDNTELSQNISPSLTTINISKTDISLKAFKRMLHRIKQPSMEPQTDLINNWLVRRDSVKRIAAEQLSIR